MVTTFISQDKTKPYYGQPVFQNPQGQIVPVTQPIFDNRGVAPETDIHREQEILRAKQGQPSTDLGTVEAVGQANQRLAKPVQQPVAQTLTKQEVHTAVLNKFEGKTETAKEEAQRKVIGTGSTKMSQEDVQKKIYSTGIVNAPPPLMAQSYISKEEKEQIIGQYITAPGTTVTGIRGDPLTEKMKEYTQRLDLQPRGTNIVSQYLGPSTLKESEMLKSLVLKQPATPERAQALSTLSQAQATSKIRGVGSLGLNIIKTAGLTKGLTTATELIGAAGSAGLASLASKGIIKTATAAKVASTTGLVSTGVMEGGAYFTTLGSGFKGVEKIAYRGDVEGGTQQLLDTGAMLAGFKIGSRQIPTEVFTRGISNVRGYVPTKVKIQSGDAIVEKWVPQKYVALKGVGDTISILKPKAVDIYGRGITDLSSGPQTGFTTKINIATTRGVTTQDFPRSYLTYGKVEWTPEVAYALKPKYSKDLLDVTYSEYDFAKGKQIDLTKYGIPKEKFQTTPIVKTESGETVVAGKSKSLEWGKKIKEDMGQVFVKYKKNWEWPAKYSVRSENVLRNAYKPNIDYSPTGRQGILETNKVFKGSTVKPKSEFMKKLEQNIDMKNKQDDFLNKQYQQEKKLKLQQEKKQANIIQQETKKQFGQSTQQMSKTSGRQQLVLQKPQKQSQWVEMNIADLPTTKIERRVINYNEANKFVESFKPKILSEYATKSKQSLISLQLPSMKQYTSPTTKIESTTKIDQIIKQESTTKIDQMLKLKSTTKIDQILSPPSTTYKNYFTDTYRGVKPPTSTSIILPPIFKLPEGIANVDKMLKRKVKTKVKVNVVKSLFSKNFMKNIKGKI